MNGPVHSVVISGIGGKFPETDNVLQLQEKLFAKEDFITNEMRWTPDTIGVGKMRDIDSFDTSPFKMHSKLVRATDPTTTQTLERAFEAIIDAGMNPFAMSGRNIAVISASMVSDSENTRAGTSYEASGFTIMGHNRSMVSNRISYTFNFTGPSYSIHTSWAGGARALQQGAELIAQGFVEAAIVSTASLIFYKATALEYEDMDMATPGGRCRSFDADANGTCRSEGVVSFFLQRASDAKRNYATVVSAQAECLGLRACSLIHFDMLLTENLQNFYKKNNIDPDDIAYLEADGSGVKYFDTLELNSLSSVFGKRKKPLPIGSVKSNVGNTEASSSFIGITKSIIAMETGLIPPNIHYTRPNPDIPSLVNGQFQPVTEAQLLEGDLVSINTLSLGGTSGHVVIRRNSKEKQVLTKGQLPPDRLHRLIMVSARHEEGAKANAEKLQNMPVDTEYASLVNDVFKTNIPGYLWKSFVVVPSNEVKYNIKKFDNVKQPLWYVFSGMGSQWPGMGRDLLQIPVFAAAVDKCAAVLRPRGVDIHHILTTDDSSVFENILNCFVGIAAIQIGLVDILRTIGLEPDGMVGHSVGELGCAYADGCFSAEEMVLAAYARGKASLDCEVIHGMMAAIGLGYEEMRKRVPPSIDVACHNAHDSCTLSGPTEDVLNYVKQLKEEGIFAKAVSAGNIAYHSRYIKPVAPKLLEYLSELITEPKPRSAKWVSSSVPQSEWSSEAAQLSSAEYHTNNLLSAVLFEEACKHLPQNAVVVEIAPHGLLQAILRRSLSSGCINVPLTNRSASNGVRQLLEALGTLYLNNVSLDVNALYPPVEYPVSRGTPYIAPLVTWDHHDTWFHEFENILQLMSHSNEEEVNMDESFEDYFLWTNHCIEDQIVLPASQVLVYIWNLHLTSNALEFEKAPILIEDMIMSRQVIFQPFSQQLVMTIRNGTNDFGVLLKEKDVYGETFLTGRVKNIQQTTLDIARDKEEEEDGEAVDISGTEVLDVLSHFGYQLGPKFHAIKHICVKNKGFTSEVEWTGNMVTFIDALFKLILFLEIESQQKFLYPSSFRTLIVDSASFFQLKQGTSVDVHYDSRNNILSCKGLLLVGLTMSPDPVFNTKVTPLQWKKTTFIPFSCEKLKMEEFLSVSVQLVAEDRLNCWKNKTSQISILLIRDSNETKSLLGKPLKNTFRNLPNVSVKIQEMELSQARDKIQFKPGESYLVIGKFSSLEQLMASVESSVFMLAHDQGTLALTNSLRPILVHHLKDGNRLTLLKKRINVEQVRIFEPDTEHWLNELAHLFNGSDNGQPVIVVTRKWDPQEILPTIANQKYSHRVRCIFLDKSAPQFSPSSPIYRDHLSMGLSVCKMSKGVWGIDCTLTLVLDPSYHPEHLQALITSSDENLDVNILSLNTTTVTFQPDNPPEQIEIQFLDYCGTRDNGERVMGLAYFNSFTNSLTPDPTLIWSIPQLWSMEEAATVVSSFSLAYYSLYVKAKLLPGERVLVHVGSCPVSQACISVALFAGADVYVTIKNKDELPSLLRTFPQLNIEHVVPLEHFNTAVKLKTVGEGVEVVVNCLQDTDTTKSISCLSSDSKFIQLSNIDLRQRETIGMGAFIKNSNFFGVNLTNILNADSETKNKLQNYLRDGIKKGVVKPLRKQSFRLENFSQALDHLKTHNSEEKTLVVIKAEGRSELPLTSLMGFHCDAEETYIIIGAGGLWLELAEWLVQRGARKLFVAPTTELSPNISRRFHRLTSLCYIKVTVTLASRLVSHSGASEFIRDAEQLGPVAAVFCVTMEENCPMIAYLDSATRELLPHLKHFVCLLGGCTNVCKYRALSDLPVCLIRSHSVYELHKPHSLLPYLSYILCNCSSTSYMFTVSAQEVTTNQADDELVEQDPRSLLPSSLQELLIVAEDLVTEPSLREMVTRCPRHENVKHNLLPVFLLPSTHATNIQPLIRHMIHPVYCINWSESAESVESIADALLKEVLRVQQDGPYNVVGDSWSGAVALQLAILLEGCGHRVELFLLNAAPLTIQNSVRALSCNFNDSLDVAILSTLLSQDSQFAKHMTESSSWEDLLHKALDLIQPRLQQLESTEEVQHRVSVQHRVGKALTALRNQLKTLLCYKPQDNLFKGSVHLIRPKGASDIDFCGLQQCCQQRPNVYVMEEEDSHDQMVQSHNCATIINKNLLYSWDL